MSSTDNLAKKIKNKKKEISNKITKALNDIVQVTNVIHEDADKKLEEMVKMCAGKHE